MTDFATALGLGAEAAMAFLDTESITYTPLAGAGVPRDALVERLGPQRLSGLGSVPLARVTLRNDAAAGRPASGIDTGGDTITWSPKRGGATRVSRVLEIEWQNGGFVGLLIG
ncbi:hypothetical protein M0R72_14470 [Candidatus Pacearchaeota archaeon]|jgi:hypothetical protein|nr:hypothetical protein [Candidatus Pacearchaeota archaeon]